LQEASLMVFIHYFITQLDTYSWTDPNGTNIPILETGIAWSEDIGIYQNANLTNQWIDVTNGKFLFIALITDC
jgi:hypothetical protein